MYTIHTNINNGFTLIEFLLYMSIVIAMLGVFAGMADSALRGKGSTETLAEMNYSLSRVLPKIELALSRAESVSLPTYSNGSQTLVLHMTDSAADPTIFELQDNQILMKEGDGDYLNISSTNLKVLDLVFTNLSVIDSSPAVRMELKLGDIGGSSLEYDFITTLKSRK